MLIYKLGTHLYFKDGKTIDKNSGLFESNLIKSEFSKKDSMDRQDLAVIIGGVMTNSDKDVLDKISSTCKKKVFIATDYSVFNTCLDFANSCDLVLHQAKIDIPIITTNQTYGYMPELFYKDTEKPAYQHDLIIFGGNNLNRQDLLNKYVFDEKGRVNKKMFTLVKNYDTMNDTRLVYEEYIKLFRLFKYSLIIARKEYRDLHWTTSRFVESISNWVYPIVDSEYDLSRHFPYDTDFEWNRVSNYSNLMLCSESKADREDYIIECQDKIREDRKKFKELILNV